jgi:transcriptional regulator with XRE-family HTH domain
MTWRRFGQQIKRLREARGFTQEQLAAKAGLSRIYVAKLEAGDRRSPSFPVLERLTRALGARLVIDLKPRDRKEED